MPRAGCGTRLARARRMGVKRFTELRAWQLARQLKIEVDRTILANPKAQADRKFFDQLSDAVRSAPRNLAEGFGRFGHKEFAHFTNISRASLQEVQNHLLDASDRDFTTEAEHRRLWALSEEALASTTALAQVAHRTQARLAQPGSLRTPHPAPRTQHSAPRTQDSAPRTQDSAPAHSHRTSHSPHPARTSALRTPHAAPASCYTPPSSLTRTREFAKRGNMHTTRPEVPPCR